MMLWNYVKLTLVGLTVGLLADIAGAGAYAMIIFGLISLNIMKDYKLAIGTSLAALLPPVGILAVYNHYNMGNVNISYAIYLAVMIIIGTYIASYFDTRIDKHVIKRVYGIFLILLGFILLFNHNNNTTQKRK